MSKPKKYSCRFCGLEFYSKEDCSFHENNECDLNPNLLKNKSTFGFISFVASSTLTVAGLALIVFSPALLYLFLLLYVSPQYGYVALAIFWIVLFGSLMILAAVMDHIRKSKGK